MASPVGGDAIFIGREYTERARLILLWFEIAPVAVRKDFPLPAKRGERQGQGFIFCSGSVSIWVHLWLNCLVGFPPSASLRLKHVGVAAEHNIPRTGYGLSLVRMLKKCTVLANSRCIGVRIA